MSTEAINRNRGIASTDDRTERAREAVRVFRSMQHSLTAYARAITKDKRVRVEVSAGAPATDGSIIKYRPPIELGDKTPHRRSDCDKRHPRTGLLVCPACAVREQVLVNIYHEIAHIAFGTFQVTTDKARRDALELAVKEWGGRYREQIEARMKSAPAQMTRDYLSLSSLISPFLPILVNALEDARVDSSMFAARKGTRKMLQADTYAILRDGSADWSGEVKKWSDAPLNSQAALACYLYGAGYEDWEQYFHEKITEDFSDAKLREILDKIPFTRTAADSYSLAFPILARLRELGYFQLPEDEEEDFQEDEKEEEKDESSSESGDDSGDDTEQEEQINDTDSDGVPESSPGPGDGGSEPDESGAPFDSSESQGGESQAGNDDGVPSGESDSTNQGGEPGGDQQAGPPGDGDQSDLSSADLNGGEAGESSNPKGDVSGELDDRVGSELKSPEDSQEGETSTSDREASHAVQPEQGGDDEAEGESRSDNSSSEEPESEHTEPGVDGLGTDTLSGDGQPVTPNEAECYDDPDDPGEGHSNSADTPEPEGVMESGADQGLGGIQVPEQVLPEYGDAGDVERDLGDIHGKKNPTDSSHSEYKAQGEDQKAITIAVIQGQYFETPSVNVLYVNEYTVDNPGRGFAHAPEYKNLTAENREFLGIDCDIDVPESAIGPALMQIRRIFTDNKIASFERNRKSGRIDKRVLGRRAWGDDERLFSKKRLPGKKSYAVLIGIDISSSTLGNNLALAKRAAFAQAELCERTGVAFAMYAHSANGIRRGGRRVGMSMDIHLVKSWNQPWDNEAKSRIGALVGNGGNLDGHTLEFYRRMLDKVEATDKILLYYTDGKMPAANHDEELEVLQREIRICHQKKYTLLGVGIRTDSPIRHGLDTVMVQGDEDIKKVVEHLGQRLSKTGR